MIIISSWIIDVSTSSQERVSQSPAVRPFTLIALRHPVVSALLDDHRASLADLLDGLGSPLHVVLPEVFEENVVNLRYQLELLSLLADAEQTAVVVLHDLSLAARFCDRLVMLDRGRVMASGTPLDVLKPALIREVFAVEAEVESGRFGDVRIHYRT